MKNELPGIIIGIVVGIIVIGTLLVPTINVVSQETISVTNTGAGELRYVYNAEPVDYSSTIVYTDVSDEIMTGFGGADLQTIAAVESVLWASDIGAVIFNGSTFYLVADDGETAVNTDLGDGFTVTVSEGVVTISDSEDTVYSGTITWSYAPKPTGTFAFYTDTEKNIVRFPLAAVGSFVGISTYNELSSDDRFDLESTVTDGVVEEVSWVKSE